MNTIHSSNRSGSPKPVGGPLLDRGSWIILQCRLERVDHSLLNHWVDEKLNALEESMKDFRTQTSLNKILRQERHSS